jgi:hypothetical protein
VAAGVPTRQIAQPARSVIETSIGAGSPSIATQGAPLAWFRISIAARPLGSGPARSGSTTAATACLAVHRLVKYSWRRLVKRIEAAWARSAADSHRS